MPGTSPTVLLLSSGWETDPWSDSNGMLGIVKSSTLPWASVLVTFEAGGTLGQEQQGQFPGSTGLEA